MKWQKATLGNSEHPAHRLLPTLTALRQREDAPMEEGEEEVLTLSPTPQPQSPASSDRAGLPKCIARCWDDRRLRYRLVCGDL